MGKRQRSEDGICSIGVQGFKCLAKESSIEIRPLTILAGANRSGKSTIMQSLLLMKQTLQASYDPGALLLNGPNVRLTSIDQLVSRPQVDLSNHAFTFSVEAPKSITHSITFFPSEDREIEIQEMYIDRDNEDARSIHLTPGRKGSDLQKELSRLLPGESVPEPPYGTQLVIDRYRCFLAFTYKVIADNESSFSIPKFGLFPSNYLELMIHVPGLRGNP